MNNIEIRKKLSEMAVPLNNYLVFQTDIAGNFFGKDKDGRVVFMIESKAPLVPSVNQETKSLKFVFNKRCILQCGSESKNEMMHVLICKDNKEESISTFIRLTRAFAAIEDGQDQYFFAKLFASLSLLFDKQRKVSEIEVQGLFAELYTILYVEQKGLNISSYWQSKNKMKFDFSFGEKKRIEIKSTLKNERIHHFRHDQLLNELYDIKIVSVMLQKNDGGISLSDIVDKIRSKFSNNFSLMLHIDLIVSQIDDDYLYGLKYDRLYLDNNIRFYDANNIPHFAEKTPDGVFNAEYDCSLDTAPALEVDEIIHWIKN